MRLGAPGANPVNKEPAPFVPVASPSGAPVLRARKPDPDDEQICALTAELPQALADPRRLPGDELSAAVEYDDDSDEAYLRRLSHDLYGDQPSTARDRQKQAAKAQAGRRRYTQLARR